MSTFDDRVRRLTADRRELLRLWLADGGAATEGGESDGTPPSTPDEALLTAVWRDVLDVPDIGVHDDYFALGGDSILAIVVVAKAQQAGLALTTQDLFELRTIRRLAEALATSSRPVPAAQPDAEPDQVRGAGGRIAAYPLTPMQEGMLFHCLADPAGTAYVVQVSCRLDGDVHIDQFADVCQAMVDRHPVLRTSFDWSGDRPRQLLHASATLPIDVADWRRLGASAQQRAVSDYLAADRRRGLPLGQAPLLRLALLRLADSTCVFVLTHHHLLLDGWSQQILLRELLDRYDAPGGQAGASSWFGAHLDRITADDLDRAATFWRRRLAGFRPTPAVPRSGAEPNAFATRHRTAEAVVTEACSAALTAFARRHGVTLGTILYGGWALQLSRLTGQTQVGFGVTVAGRPPELPGATEALGMFINTLPLRVGVPPAETLVPWLMVLQHHRSQLDAFHYTPLTLVARCLPDQAERRIFDTIAVIENFPQLVAEGPASRRLVVRDIESHVTEGYPLVFEARPSYPIRLRLRYDAGLVAAELVEASLASLLAYLQRLGDQPDATGQTLAQLLACMNEGAQHVHAAAVARLRAADAGAMLATRRRPVAIPPAG